MIFPDEVEEDRKVAGWHEAEWEITSLGQTKTFPAHEFWMSSYVNPERTFLRGRVVGDDRHWYWFFYSPLGHKQQGGIKNSLDEAKRKIESVATDRLDHARRMMSQRSTRSSLGKVGQ